MNNEQASQMGQRIAADSSGRPDGMISAGRCGSTYNGVVNVRRRVLIRIANYEYSV